MEIGALGSLRVRAKMARFDPEFNRLLASIMVWIWDVGNNTSSLRKLSQHNVTVVLLHH